MLPVCSSDNDQQNSAMPAGPTQRTKPKGTAPLIMATWNATKLTPAKTHELLGLASKSQVLIILFIYLFIYMYHLVQQQGRCDGSTLT